MATLKYRDKDGTIKKIRIPDGSTIVVDSELSEVSENPVQNKIVTVELEKKIETLDDDSQEPDAVNFDLDQALSLTSTKGVQNKVIAQEFQKYANGTKVAAKASEANTATTASNAEKVNGHTVGTDVPNNAVFTDTVYDDSAVKTSIQNIVDGTTQVGSATKATQDAQGNVIDTTYAKKTEVPQGTVVDDALSSTSTNPVQNKVVKAEFDQVNSNLSVIGKCKNIFNPTFYSGWYCTGSVGINGKISISPTNSDVATIFATIKKCSLKAGKTYYITVFEPDNIGYISAYKNSDTSYATILFVNSANNNWVYRYSPTEDIDLQFLVYVSDKTVGVTASCYISVSESYADEYLPYTGDGETLTADVAELKNDLSNLKDGTTPVAKAVADEDGNNIKSTYAKKTEIDAKANIADPVFTGSFSQNREAGTTIGSYSHAEGERTTASGKASHAEGNETTASGIYSHAEGERTTASSADSHAEGYNTTASGFYSHAEGYNTTASDGYSHAEGFNTTALEVQHAGGHFNNISTATESTNNGTGTGTSFVIGNGTQNARSNAFRINDNGEVFAKSATISTGADYAEYFEWEDGNPNNEDRRGYFVTLNNKKIKLAKPNDYILGVISGFPSVIGNGDEEWMGRYVFDDFGAPVIEEFEYENPITGETKIGTKWKENPDYDNTRPYIQRSKRQEWDAVGMLGVLSVRDDGTCVPNKYCKITDGSIATLSEDKSDYRVLERVNDNVVKIVFR